jgi:hypothetical protein
LIFWSADTDKVADSRLLLAERTSTASIESFCGAPPPIKIEGGGYFVVRSTPIVLGRGRVAVINEDYTLCILDAVNRKFTVTEHMDCWPRAARGDNRRIFCVGLNDWCSYELDLETNSKTDLPGLKGTGYLFFEELDGLLFTTQEGSMFPIPHERTVTKLYSLNDQSSCAIEPHQTIRREQTVWLRKTASPSAAQNGCAAPNWRWNA